MTNERSPKARTPEERAQRRAELRADGEKIAARKAARSWTARIEPGLRPGIYHVCAWRGPKPSVGCGAYETTSIQLTKEQAVAKLALVQRAIETGNRHLIRAAVEQLP